MLEPNTAPYLSYTKYPDIYRDKYWSGFRHNLAKNDDDIKQIGRNRDAFVETHQIRRGWKETEKLFKKHNVDFYNWTHTRGSYYDHVEWYQTYDCHVILVITPYRSREDTEKALKDDLSFGVPFIYTDPLYGNGTATTCYKKIPYCGTTKHHSCPHTRR